MPMPEWMEAQVKTATQWFSKRGRGVPQTEQVDKKGEPVFTDKDEKGNPFGNDENGKPIIKRKVGNEQFQCLQYITFPFKNEAGEPDIEVFSSVAMDVLNGDVETITDCFLDGYNRHLQSQAGGTDKWISAARQLKKKVDTFDSMSDEDLAKVLKSMDPEAMLNALGGSEDEEDES